VGVDWNAVTGVGTVAVAVSAVFVAFWSEWRSDRRLSAERCYSEQKLTEERTRSDEKLGEERRLAREREQFAEASQVEVLLAAPQRGPIDLESNPKPPPRLELTVKNHGSYAITDIEAKAWAEMLTGVSLVIFTEPRQEQRSDALNPASPYREPVLGSHPDWLPPWDARLIFEEELPSPLKNGEEEPLEGPPAYPIVRWTDRWGTGWEHMRGKLQQVDRSVTPSDVAGPGGPAGPLKPSWSYPGYRQSPSIGIR
jgi:hypothetical protein